MVDKKSTVAMYLFLAIGACLILASLAVKNYDPSNDFHEALLALGISVIGVTLIQKLWQASGGEPLVNAIDELQKSSNLLTDAHKTGLVRLMENRPPVDKEYLSSILQANEIDILGLTTRHLIHNTDFKKNIKAVGEKGGKIRIIIQDPSSIPFKQREIEEDDENRGRMKGEALEALNDYGNIKKSLSAELQENIQVRILKKRLVYFGLTRLDSEIKVTHYLNFHTGGESPTFVIDGINKLLFKMYQAQFDKLWENADPYP